MDTLLKNMLWLIDSNYQKDEDFEKEFGIAKTTVSAWRRGVLKSFEKYAYKFAVFFDVSLDWLYGLKQKNKPVTQSDELKPLDPLDRRIMELFGQLNSENKKIALAQLEAMLKIQGKQ